MRSGRASVERSGIGCSYRSPTESRFVVCEPVASAARSMCARLHALDAPLNHRIVIRQTDLTSYCESPTLVDTPKIRSISMRG